MPKIVAIPLFTAVVSREKVRKFSKVLRIVPHPRLIRLIRLIYVLMSPLVTFYHGRYCIELYRARCDLQS